MNPSLPAAAEAGPSGPIARAATIDIAFDRFSRLVAAFCLVSGVLYWMRLIGLQSGPFWRFDLMPLHWQAASASLAVVFPFAAVGLWLVAPWGPVIWFLCAAIEIVMYGFYPDRFGHHDWVIVAHVAIALCYVGFRIGYLLRRRRDLRDEDAIR